MPSALNEPAQQHNSNFLCQNWDSFVATEKLNSNNPTHLSVAVAGTRLQLHSCDVMIQMVQFNRSFRVGVMLCSVQFS